MALDGTGSYPRGRWRGKVCGAAPGGVWLGRRGCRGRRAFLGWQLLFVWCGQHRLRVSSREKHFTRSAPCSLEISRSSKRVKVPSTSVKPRCGRKRRAAAGRGLVAWASTLEIMNGASKYGELGGGGGGAVEGVEEGGGGGFAAGGMAGFDSCVCVCACQGEREGPRRLRASNATCTLLRMEP